jgi:hypothetical protein
MGTGTGTITPSGAFVLVVEDEVVGCGAGFCTAAGVVVVDDVVDGAGGICGFSTGNLLGNLGTAVVELEVEGVFAGGGEL